MDTTIVVAAIVLSLLMSVLAVVRHFRMMAAGRRAIIDALRGGESTGKEIVMRISLFSGGALELQGSLYVLLHSMETEGLIKSRLATPVPARLGHALYYYSLPDELLKYDDPEIQVIDGDPEFTQCTVCACFWDTGSPENEEHEDDCRVGQAQAERESA